MLAPLGASAQATFGTITGNITDPSGSAVPNVPVEIRNQATNELRKTVTNEAGVYEAPNLVPGLYTLRATAQGFRPVEHQNVSLGALRTVRIDMQLEIGSVESNVTITGSAPVIETDSATVYSVRDLRQLQEMPLNLRTMQGALGDSGAWAYINVTPTGQGRGVTMSLGGGRASMSDVNVDGVTSRSPTFGNLMPTNPSIETIAEVRLDYVNNRAEFSELGNITLVTRSGGNDFHGRLLWDHGNAALNARNPFATSKPAYIRNDGGATVSGPIVRDKLFFLANYEGQWLRQAATIAPNVPTLGMRQGDFSQLLALPSPIVLRDPYTGEPFPNNRIPAQMLNQGAIRYQDRFLPAPNFGPATSFAQNFRQNYPQAHHQDHSTSRVDWVITENNRLYGRFTFQRSKFAPLESNLPPELVGYRDQERQNRNFVLSDTWVVNPTLINELKIGYSRDFNPRSGPVSGQEVADLLGMQGITPQPENNKAVPGIGITGFTTLSQVAAAYPAQNVFQVSDQVTLIRGKHTIKTGADFIPQQSNDNFPPPFPGYSFNGNYTGFAYGDFLLGVPVSTSRSFPPLPRTYGYYYLNFFVQDDFKVSPSLTLNYGLRYEFNSPVVDRFDTVANFDPATGGFVIPNEEIRQRLNPLYPKEVPIRTAAEAGVPERSLRRPDKNNFLPRFGFAWRPFGGARTVLRGGYGLYNDSLTAQHARLAGGPYSGSENFFNPTSLVGAEPLLTLQRPTLDAGTPTLRAGSLSAAAMSFGLRNPYAHQWSLTVERDLGFDMGLRLSYIGTKASQLLYSRNINQLPPSSLPFDQSRVYYPNFTSISMLENGANQSFHALSVDLEKRWSRGLYFQAAWTWAKSLTDVDEWNGAAEAGLQIENAYDRARERGDSQYTPRHKLIANLIWELPIGAGKPVQAGGLLNQIVGGWNVSASYQGNTGHYLTPLFSGPDTSNTRTFGGIPDRIGDGNLPSGERQRDRWFDVTAFAIPPNGRFGNSGRGIILGPSRHTLSAALFKDFPVTERVRLRLQASFTNLPNHPNFRLPVMTFNTPATAGRLQFLEDTDYGISGVRTGLIGIRLDF